MIGKPKWFKRRKYTGWGFSPSTWEGWVYIAVVALPVIIIANMQVFGTAQVVFLVVWAIIFGIDFIDIMIHLEKDEREKIHEAISERNALWTILTVLVAGVAYQTASGVATQSIVKVDPIILIALVAGLIAKIISNIYLDKRN